MIEKYGKKGLAVVAVTNSPESEALKFADETKMKSAIGFEPSLASMKAFGFTGFPSSALVGGDGKVIWTGHPSGLKDDMVEQGLKTVRILPKYAVDVELPSKYKSIAKNLAKGKLGAGWVALEKALGKSLHEEDDKAALQKAADAVKTFHEARVAEANTAFDEGRIFDAYDAWDMIGKHFRAHREHATTAREKLKALKVPELRKEFDAGKRIAAAIEAHGKGKEKKAIKALQSLLAGSYKETKEAARAQKLLDAWKAEG